jgi:hypothetical protein
MQGFGNSVEDDCKTLLGLLIEVGENLRGHTPEDRRLVDSEPLAGKVVCHACSVLLLSRGTRLDDIPGAQVNFLDYASTLVVARTLLESVWAFYQVFVEPKTEDEAAFHYCCWMLAGFVQRDEFPAITGWGRDQVARNVEAVSRYRQELGSTEAFGKLPRDKKKSALAGKLWRLERLRDRARAFLGEKYGPAIYGWLSSYQHADALSATQIRAASEDRRQRQMAEIALFLAAVSLSQMIRAYLRLWPQLEEVTSRHPNIGTLVEMYVRFPQFDPDVE